ncbi:BON domain protein [Novipirellula aureliae]|uniref:BON domain protein n=1 Tax=Novipirellula aureliae TaxID=2527966 RepID=A0A5C6DXG5_9BACT|nr:BON domain-containing protein [Novipirellula aureliae]TWU40071.1 BON domain protein [Novipirellula aureliae]
MNTLHTLGHYDSQLTHEVEVDIQQAFRSTRYSALRDVTFLWNDGILMLRGTVRTYFLKQLAQECVRDVNGVTHVINSIKVA